MPEPSGLYVGLMSGTSMDGIDAALVSFGDHTCRIHHTLSFPYPVTLRQDLLESVVNPERCTVDRIGELDQRVGRLFADATNSLLLEAGANPADVQAIGSHGQTLRHRPNGETPFTWQIGDPNVIAFETGITTVADFRRADVAAGGDGAPLAPAFHHWLFADPKSVRVVLNIGGIANITVLHARESAVTGFDTGPGNTLLDAWIRCCRNEPLDDRGAWAASGAVVPALLQRMVSDPYFAAPPPKSTGFEYFNERWIRGVLADHDGPQYAPADIQATLSELTATTVAGAISEFAKGADKLLICGGGVHNTDLIERLRRQLPRFALSSTADFGLHPDWVEAAAFAWLAKRRLDGRHGNLPGVTGATGPRILGGIFSGTG